METVCNEKTDLHSFLCVSQHRCKHLTLKQAQMPSQAVLISHNLKHSIIGSADIHTPTHHLTVNAAGCYLILFIFFTPYQYQMQSAREEDRRVIPQNIPVSQSAWQLRRIIRWLRTRAQSARPSTIHTTSVSLAMSSLQALELGSRKIIPCQVSFTHDYMLHSL